MENKSGLGNFSKIPTPHNVLTFQKKNMRFLMFFLLAIVLIPVIGCNDKSDKEAVTNSDSAVTSTPDALFSKYKLERVRLPSGFHINVYAEVPNARSMVFGEKGTLFVGNRDEDKVYAVVDNNNDGTADSVYIIDSKLTKPCGVAFR
ncbi:MAG TPA: hypothetical protein VM101_01625, partial [Flavitalea sp.]|nr:hypothetical protein [Flavitalea sp.]